MLNHDCDQNGQRLCGFILDMQVFFCSSFYLHFLSFLGTTGSSGNFCKYVLEKLTPQPNPGCRNLFSSACCLSHFLTPSQQQLVSSSASWDCHLYKVNLTSFRKGPFILCVLTSISYGRVRFKVTFL